MTLMTDDKESEKKKIDNFRTKKGKNLKKEIFYFYIIFFNKKKM